MSDESTPSVGLCTACRHARRVTSAKRSTFVMCGLGTTDPRFPKYPRLPVARCDGFQPSPDATPPQGHQR